MTENENLEPTGHTKTVLLRTGVESNHRGHEVAAIDIASMVLLPTSNPFPARITTRADDVVVPAKRGRPRERQYDVGTTCD